MRWNYSTYKMPRDGDVKVIKKFLYFPKRINGKARWLEMGNWEESYSAGGYVLDSYWVPTHWID